MYRFLSTLLLGATLMAPVALRADDDHHDGKYKRKDRYYDRQAKDWHQWNESEQRAYNRYLQERRLRERAWERSNAAQQREYWRWRHAHPDTVIIERR